MATRLARDRHNHFVRNRIDFQRSVFGGDRVVARQRAFVQRVGELVRALANFRLASRHVVRRALTFNKANSRHSVVRQRRAVVGLAGRTGGQLHRALSNPQRTKRRCDLVFAVNFFVRHEGERVRNRAIGHVRHSARHVARHVVFPNKANSRHRVVRQRRAVVDLAGRSRGLRHVLIIVESNLVIAFSNCLFLTQNRRITFNFLWPNLFSIASIQRSRRVTCDRLGRPVPVVVHRIVVAVPRIIEVELVLAILNRNFNKVRAFFIGVPVNTLLLRISGDHSRNILIQCRRFRLRIRNIFVSNGITVIYRVFQGRLFYKQRLIHCALVTSIFLVQMVRYISCRQISVGANKFVFYTLSVLLIPANKYIPFIRNRSRNDVLRILYRVSVYDLSGQNLHVVIFSSNITAVFMRIINLYRLLSVVERQRIRLFFKRDCLRLGMTIHRIEGIYTILQGSRGCNGSVIPIHIAIYKRKLEHSILIIPIDILYSILRWNRLNLNFSIQMKCGCSSWHKCVIGILSVCAVFTNKAKPRNIF